MEDSIEDDVHGLDHSQYDVLVPALKPPKVSVAVNNRDVEGNASWLDWERHGACDSHGHYIRCIRCSYIKRVSDHSRSKRLEGIRELKRHYHTKHHKVFPKSSKGMHEWCLLPEYQNGAYRITKSNRHVAGKAAHMRRIPETFWVPNAARADQKIVFKVLSAFPESVPTRLNGRGQLYKDHTAILRLDTQPSRKVADGKYPCIPGKPAIVPAR